MRINIIKRSSLTLILFTFLGCSDYTECNKKLNEQTLELNNIKEQLNKSQAEVEDYKKKVSRGTINMLQSRYRPAQSQTPLTSAEIIKYKNRHFDTDGISGNSFNTSVNNGEIYLKFPIYNPPNKTNEIVDVLDVSSKDINAIVVLLNKIDGIRTTDKDVSHFLTTTIKIDKVNGLKKDSLKTHKELKVYIFHDDAFYTDNLLIAFKNCVKSMGATYSDVPCILPKRVVPDRFNFMKPREQEGDIIPGN